MCSLNKYVGLVKSLPVELQVQSIAYSIQTISWSNQLWLQFIHVFVFVSPHPSMEILLLQNKLRIKIKLSFQTILDFETEIPDPKYISPKISNYNIETIRYTNNSIDNGFWNSHNVTRFINVLDTALTDFTLTLSRQINRSTFGKLINNHKSSFGRELTSVETSDSLLDDIVLLKDCLNLPLNYLKINLSFAHFDADKFRRALQLRAILQFHTYQLHPGELSKILNFCENTESIIEILCHGPIHINEDTIQVLKYVRNQIPLLQISRTLYYKIRENSEYSHKLMAQMKHIKNLSLEDSEFKNYVLPNFSCASFYIKSNHFSNFNFKNLKASLLDIGHIKMNKGNEHEIDKRTIESISSSITSLKLNVTTKPGNDIGLPKFLQEFTCRLENLKYFNFKDCSHLVKLELVGVCIFENNEIWNSIPYGIEKIIIDATRESNNYTSGKMFGINFGLPNFKGSKVEVHLDYRNRYVCINMNLPFSLNVEGWHWSRINVSKSSKTEIKFNNQYFPNLMLSGEFNNWLKVKDTMDRDIFPIAMLQDPGLFTFNIRRVKTHFSSKQVFLIEVL